MPFKRAHYFILLLIVAAGFAFWRDYFSTLSSAPYAWHLHGITASLWLAVLALQGWSISVRRVPLHRAVGKASLGLFPLFFAGGGAVVWTMAKARPGDIFYEIYGARLGTVDIAADVAVAYLFYHALRDRRIVQLHARYMLATSLFLITPTVGRLFTHFMPGLMMRGPQDFYLFAYSTHLANLVAIGISAWLYREAPRHGRPFLIAAVVMVAQSALFETIGRTEAWRALFVRIGAVHELGWILAALLVGAAVTWLGWTAGRPPVRKPTVLAEAA